MNSADAHFVRYFREKLKSPLSADDLSSVDAFMKYHDEMFVTYAYNVLFGREPDPVGMRYYVDRLRGGKSRISILNQMVRAHEVRPDWESVPGLAAALDQYRKSNKWTGWFRFRQNLELSVAQWARQARIYQNSMEAQAQSFRYVAERLEVEYHKSSEVLGKISADLNDLGSEDAERLVDFCSLTPRKIDEVRERDVPGEITMVVARLKR